MPKFDDPAAYRPGIDVLEFSLIDIYLNDLRTGYVGVRLEVDHGDAWGESIGHADRYQGNFDLRYQQSQNGNAITHYTRALSMGRLESGDEAEVITESWIQIENDSIVAVALSFPIYKTRKTSEGTTYNTFTGAHQKICITDMR